MKFTSSFTSTLIAVLFTATCYAGGPPFEGEIQFDPIQNHTEHHYDRIRICPKSMCAPDFVWLGIYSINSGSSAPSLVTTNFEFVRIKKKSGKDQVGIVFRFEQLPHQWYFVYVGHQQVEQTRFPGLIYRVNSSLKQILQLLKKEIVYPTKVGWVEVGSGQLTQWGDSFP